MRLIITYNYAQLRAIIPGLANRLNIPEYSLGPDNTPGAS